MAAHNTLTGAELHEPKGVAAAAAGLVYQSDGAGSGSFKKFKPDHLVIVNAMSDFPTPSAGVITLAADTFYIVGNDLATADRFALSANVGLSSLQTNGPTLDYTGTGAMFTGSSVDFTVTNARLKANSGTLLDLTGGFMRLDNSTIEGTTKDGKLTDIVGLVINRCTFLDSDDGFEYLGTAPSAVLSLSKIRYVTTSATNEFIDLGTIVFSSLEIMDIVFDTPAGAIAIKGAAASANIASGKLALVTSCEFDPDMTVLSGVSTTDFRWEFQANSGLIDSFKAADTFITSTQTVTIVTQSVFVVINGGSWTSDVANRFTTSSSGLLTYISEIDATFLVSGVATIEKTVGGTDVLEMRVCKNGTALPKSSSFTETTTPATVSSQALVALTAGDTLELAVANNSSTGNVDVNVANLTVRASG